MVGDYGENLIFVISQPRAGSTLLQRILAGATGVHTTAEPWLMLPLVHIWKDVPGNTAVYDTALSNLAIREFAETLPGGLATLQKRIRSAAVNLYNDSLPAGKTIFLDKTPRYYLIIPELKFLFPRAKFVILLRNPLAVLASILDTWVKDAPENLLYYKPDLEQAPTLLADAVKSGVGISVDYEALVTSPHGVTATLCRELDLEYTGSLVSYGDRPKPHGSMGDPTGVEKYRRPTSLNVDKWVMTLATPSNWTIADAHLNSLPEDVCETLGYSKPFLRKQLDSIKP